MQQDKGKKAGEDKPTAENTAQNGESASHAERNMGHIYSFLNMTNTTANNTIGESSAVASSELSVSTDNALVVERSFRYMMKSCLSHMKKLLSENAKFLNHKHSTRSLIVISMLCLGVGKIDSIGIIKNIMTPYDTAVDGKMYRELGPYSNWSAHKYTTNEVHEWAMIAVSKTFGMNFVNYKAQIAEISPSFTDNGLKSLQAELERTGTLNSIIKNKYIQSISVSKVTTTVSNNDRWHLDIPVILTYQNESRISQLHAKLNIEVIDDKKTISLKIDKITIEAQ